MNEKINVSLPLDSDGFLSQECPECSRRFKVRFEESTGKALAYCPYCGHHGSGCWWTTEQAEYMTALVGQQIVEPMLDEFTRDMRSLSNDFLKFDAKISERANPRVPVEPDTPMPSATFACCDETIKHEAGDADLCCIICGKRSSESAKSEQTT